MNIPKMPTKQVTVTPILPECQKQEENKKCYKKKKLLAIAATIVILVVCSVSIILSM